MSASPDRIAAAALLPPLGAYLAAGPGRVFALACLLTVLGFVPGMLFALYLVLRPHPALA
jgi:uncharacterized membrane protein YqaE (UPF0057 family)